MLQVYVTVHVTGIRYMLQESVTVYVTLTVHVVLHVTGICYRYVLQVCVTGICHSICYSICYSTDKYDIIPWMTCETVN